MEFLSYFFAAPESYDESGLDLKTRKTIAEEFLAVYSYEDDAAAWFSKVRSIAEKYGFATDMKEYKLSPESFKGSVADVAEVLRIATTGKANTPDLWTIQHILGEKETRSRLKNAVSAWEKA